VAPVWSSLTGPSTSAPQPSPVWPRSCRHFVDRFKLHPEYHAGAETVPARRVLPGQSHYQAADLRADGLAAGLTRVRPLAPDEAAVPGQQRAGCGVRAHLVGGGAAFGSALVRPGQVRVQDRGPRSPGVRVQGRGAAAKLAADGLSRQGSVPSAAARAMQVRSVSLGLRLARLGAGPTKPPGLAALFPRCTERC
jgi:hypothetical protein